MESVKTSCRVSVVQLPGGQLPRRESGSFQKCRVEEKIMKSRLYVSRKALKTRQLCRE